MRQERGAALASELFGGQSADEHAPTTEAEVMELVGFDPEKKDYTNHEMTVLAKKAQKMCKKYRIGEYAPGGAGTGEEDGEAS